MTSRSRRSVDDAEAEALEILAEVDEDTKKLLMGFQMEEFFLDCQYAGSTCRMEYVPPFLVFLYFLLCHSEFEVSIVHGF